MSLAHQIKPAVQVAAVVPQAKADTLPALIDRATRALAEARSSAEVLEARDIARVAYDAAKSAGRLARQKQAHDTVIAQVYRAQAEALLIESRAKMRLAEEFDAAQERGEVKTRADNQHVPDQNKLSPQDIGLSRKDIHEARQVRDAEKADPGIAQRALNSMVERGEEPTKAKLNREIITRPKPEKVMDQTALWLWGRLRDFERDCVLEKSPEILIAEMTEAMRADVKRLAPKVRDFLNDMETFA